MSASTRKRALMMFIKAGSLVIALAIGWGAWRLLSRDSETSSADVQSTADLIARGEYLARAADCAACHTVPGREPFSGGLAFKLPFGTIYSTNITADHETGIGDWSDNDFVRALHRGVAKDGSNLYPAFPYTSYAAMSRADAIAIKTYLFSLSPVHAPSIPNTLSFPFKYRWLMALWNLAFLDEYRFRVDPDLSPAENRGAYLATALGHCGECHTPRNFGFALIQRRQFSGETIQGWRAYNISSDAKMGIGSWSDQQLAEYLKTGHARGRGTASGPMAEVVTNSLQFLTSEDISALVSYLRKVPAQDGHPDTTTSSAAPTVTNEIASAPNELGKRVFDGNCSGCHLSSGYGRQSAYADLVGARGVYDPTATNIIQVLLNGTDLRGAHPLIAMPAFAKGLSDGEIAAVADYLIGKFGGIRARATADDVRKARSDMH
jgi:mono/diheme cytochrome c family protein